MLIQSKLPAAPTVNNATWQFSLDRAGRYVCEVTDEKSIAMLLAVVDIYSEAKPLDDVKPVFKPEPERQPHGDAPMSIETVEADEFDALVDKNDAKFAPKPAAPAVGRFAPKPAAIPATTDEPALNVDQATTMFSDRQAERIRIEGEEAEQRQAASLAETQAGLGAEDPAPVLHDLAPVREELGLLGVGPGFAPFDPNPLDPNNEFPMDPGENVTGAGTAFGHVVEEGAVSTSGVARDPDADLPSAEDPNLTNAQLAAKKRSAKKKQAKRSPRRR